MNLNTYLNFKWIKDVKVQTIRLLGDNLGENFHGLGLNKDFFKYQTHAP